MTENGAELKPGAGVRAEFRAIKKDGKSIDNPATIEEGGTILACLTDQTLAVAGEVRADISLKEGDAVVSTLNFLIYVEEAPLGKNIPSTNEFGTMLEATRAAEAAAGEAREAAGTANTAAGAADAATGRANDAAGLIEDMTVSASKVAAGGNPTAVLTKAAGRYELALGLVTGDKGDTGPRGEKGDTGPAGPQGPTGPAGGVNSVNGKAGEVTLSKTDIGLGNVDNTADSAKDVASAGKVRHALTFAGAASGTWNGSEDKTVNIPAAPTAAAMFLAAHPVGSYYWSGNATSPAQLYGGTWSQIKDRFVLAAGDTYKADDTGGEAAVALTVAQLASHTHNFINRPDNVNLTYDLNMQGTSYPTRAAFAKGADTYSGGGARLETTGSGEAHNNMPPYIVAYCWKRTA